MPSPIESLKTPIALTSSVNYQNATIGELTALWQFDELERPVDAFLVAKATKAICDLITRPWLQRLGCSKAHLIQSVIRVLVESTKEMEAAVEAGDPVATAYLNRVVMAPR
jgi:hypothetical protein